MQRRRIAVLALLALIIAPSTTYGFRFARWWWWLPPADPIQDVTFPEVSTHNVRCLEFLVVDRKLDSYERTSFDDVNTTANVTGGMVTVDPFEVTNTDDDVIVFSFETAELHENLFGSTFYTNGTATVGTNEPTDVTLWGKIVERHGEYRIGGKVFGYSRNEVDNTIEYKLIRLRLRGTTPVEEEVPADTPTG